MHELNRDREPVTTSFPLSLTTRFKGPAPVAISLLPIAPTFEATFPVVRYALHCIILIIQYNS